MEARKSKRHQVHCYVLDHSTDDGVVRDCIDFSSGGMRLSGASKAENFDITVVLPNSSKRVKVGVQKKYQGDDFFGVEFVNPPSDLVQSLGWWE